MSEHSSNGVKKDNDILILNGFCFLEIFKHLSPYDLASFKAAYGSVGEVADMEFTRKTRGSLHFEWKEDWKINEDLRLIKNFGSSVNRLTISHYSSRSKWSEIFLVIGKFCNLKLKNLTLSGNFQFIQNANISLIASLLKNVTKLTLRNRYYSPDEGPHDFINILCHCEKVTSVSVLSLSGIAVHETMFRKNKNLLNLELIGPINENGVKVIADNLMKTQLRYFLRFGGNFSQIHRLNGLRHCAIDCSFVNIKSFLQDVDTFDSLNVLSLLRARLDRTNISTLRRMPRLKILELMFTDSPFESILSLCGNQNLEQLIIYYYGEVVTEANYLRAIEKRKESRAEKCLHLTLRPAVYDSALKAIPSELLEANEKTIKLVRSSRYMHESYIF